MMLECPRSLVPDCPEVSVGVQEFVLGLSQKTRPTVTYMLETYVDPGPNILSHATRSSAERASRAAAVEFVCSRVAIQ